MVDLNDGETAGETEFTKLVEFKTGIELLAHDAPNATEGDPIIAQVQNDIITKV